MLKIKVQIYDIALAVLLSNLGSIKAKEYIMLNEYIIEIQH
jgi:hypothetical protein